VLGRFSAKWIISDWTACPEPCRRWTTGQIELLSGRICELHTHAPRDPALITTQESTKSSLGSNAACDQSHAKQSND
jgi:hypothetical protein